MPSKTVSAKTADAPVTAAAAPVTKITKVRSAAPASLTEEPAAPGKATVAKAAGPTAKPVPAPPSAPAANAGIRPAKAASPAVKPEPELETVVPEPVEQVPAITSPVVDAPAVVAAKPAPEPQFRSPPKMPGHMPGMHGRPQIAPRAMAAKENFAEGDYVVYPTHGVGKVERIATEEIAGHKLELIHITFEENRMTLRVPVAKARTAGLRKLATRVTFDKALALMKGRARIKRTMWSRRAQEYEQKINSGDPLQIAEVVRDLYRNAGQPDQSFSERQIYENAMDRLAAEYAALEKTDKATAMQRLLDDLKTVVKGAAIEVDAEGEEVEPVEPA